MKKGFTLSLSKGFTLSLSKGFTLSLSKGFTLIELLIVIGTIGILAAIVLVAIDPVDKTNAANDSKVQRDIYTLARAMEAYYVQNGGIYPTGDIQGELINKGELKGRLTPPGSYFCDGASASDYIISGGPTGKVSCQLKSKKYTSASTPFWVWCSTTGTAGPTDGACP